MESLAKVMMVGVGATAVMDMWTMSLKKLGARVLDYALVGRWAGHLCKGRFAHASIAAATPVSGELLLGWAIHYFVGVTFAFVLIGVQGTEWLHDPSWLPALAVGIATVVFPLFVMQPAMGAGVASSRTATPLRNCLRSLVTHAIFGCGLYLSAVLFKQAWG